MAKEEKEEALGEDQLICVLSGNVVKATPIPSPNGDATQIERLVSEYFDKRVKGNNLENAAIDMVEREIESWQGDGR